MLSISLIVTDNNKISSNMRTVLEFIKKDACFVDCLETAREELKSNTDISLVFVAVSNQTTEEEVIGFLASEYPSLPVHLVVDSVDENSQPLALAPGVASVLHFPIDFSSLTRTIRKAELDRNTRNCHANELVSLTGRSAEILEVEALIRHVSQSDANVLLLGESGTGKEIVARSVHQQSMRANEPFIAVNCGAIPPELLESELFGHEKGAFTGAISTRRGRFELAEGGTLFLDEIGDMPMSMQVKLLRVLQERAFERVGGVKTIKSNVRLIAATHQNLEKSIDEGKFRTDLFYRLNVFPIKLPPLRQRAADIPLLIEEFARKFQLQLCQTNPIVFEQSALDALSRHPLPGNVRELENLVERLSILRPGESISYSNLPDRYQTGSPKTAGLVKVESSSQIELRAPTIKFESGTINLKQHLTTLEKDLIFQALDDTDWVVSKAAKALSLRRTTLIQKIRKLGIRSERQQEALNA